jgi:uncharacterized membrane protein YdjX (TVP38/TMEM64 family)
MGVDLTEPVSHQAESRWRAWGKPLLFLVVALLVATACFYFRGELLSAAVDSAERLRAWSRSHPIAAPLLLIAAFVVSTGLSVPSVITLSVLSGWLLGFWEGLVISSFGAATGATVAFLISRHLLRDAIAERWPRLVARADEMVDRDGAFYVLSLRLVHLIPSWLVNLVMGCTDMPVATFWWATQLGMLPAIALYVYVSARWPSLAQLKEQGVSTILTPTVIGVFIILALIPLALRQVIHRWHRVGK